MTESKKASNESSPVSTAVELGADRPGAVECDVGKDAMAEVARGGDVGAIRTAGARGGGDNGAAGRLGRAVETGRDAGADLGLLSAGMAGTAPKLSFNGSKGSKDFEGLPGRAGRPGAAERAPIRPPKSSSGGATGTCAEAPFPREPNMPAREGAGSKSSSSCALAADGREDRLPSASRSLDRIALSPSALFRGEDALSLPSSGLLDGAFLIRLKNRPIADGAGASSSVARPDPPVSTSSTPSVYGSSSSRAAGVFFGGLSAFWVEAAASSAGLAFRPNQEDFAAGFGSPSAACADATASDAD